MVAGGGTDGIEGRHPAKAGDAYYFRSNCTVEFLQPEQTRRKGSHSGGAIRIPLAQGDDQISKLIRFAVQSKRVVGWAARES